MSEELELQHHGIKGQKWGVRRFQNKDGTLTDAGKARYNEQLAKIKEIGDTQAKLEALKREITKDWDGKSKILVPKDVKSEYDKLLDKWKKAVDKYSKEEIYVDIKTMDDGADYIVSKIYDKDLDGFVEYYSLVKHSDNDSNDYLQHHGIKGQKWGIRRYQNSDGSLTEEGKIRYGVGEDGKMSEEGKQLYDADRKERKRNIAIGVGIGAAIAAAGALIVSKIVKSKIHKETLTTETVSMGKSKTEEVLLLTAGNKVPRQHTKFKGEPSLFGGKRGGIGGSYSYSGPLGKGYNIHTGRMRKMKHSCIELDAFLHSDDDEEELQHHGIKGQKWGERRFQNPDGSLTEEGKDRYGVGSSIKKNSAPKVKKEESTPKVKNDDKEPKWGLRRFQKPDGSLTEEGKKRYNADSYDKMDSANKVKYDEDRRDYNLNNINATSDILRSIGNATSAAQQIPIASGKTIRKSYPNLTDKELQERINRLSLEQRYSDLKGDTKYERSGGERVREILQTVGASVAIAGSVVAIAAKVYDMRHQIPGSKGKKKK